MEKINFIIDVHALAGSSTSKHWTFLRFVSDAAALLGGYLLDLCVSWQSQALGLTVICLDSIGVKDRE